MKILIGKFGHEANTFASHMAEYELFSHSGTLVAGEEMIAHFKGTRSDYIGGMLDAAAEQGVEVIPSVAVLTAAPTLTRDCVERVMEQLLPPIRQHCSELDGICLGLHGAGVSEDTEDLESYVLREVRQIVGPDMPIMVTLDLHANISEEMLTHSTALFGIKQYPHIDMYDAGYLAFNTLVDAIRSGEMPQCAFAPLPMVISHSAGYTFAEPFLSIQKAFKAYQETHDLIDITLFHAFPPADTPYTRTSVVVVARKDAQKAADELAAYIWSQREKFSVESLTPAEAMDRAERIEGEGYIVINELSDNPGGGTPGDGTHLLREMLRRDLPGSIFGYLYDPQAVEELLKHRIGDRVDLTLGGKTEPLHGEPIELHGAELICLSNGEVTYLSPVHAGIHDTIGKCARIRVSNVDIIIGSVLHQTYDDRPFLVTGADVNQYRYVALKSAHHFRAFFDPRALAIIAADPPGLMRGNLTSYDFKRLPRPCYPLDSDAVYLQ